MAVSQLLSLLNLLQLLAQVAYEYNVVPIQQEFAIVSEKVLPLKMVSFTTTLIRVLANRLWTLLKNVGSPLGASESRPNQLPAKKDEKRYLYDDQ